MPERTDTYEIERRYTRFDPTRLEGQLDAWGATPAEEHREADHYHNAPDRDFVRTDEVLRLRRIGDTNLITYKGPKVKGTTVKMRAELEFPLASGDEAAAQFLDLLGKLGYRPTGVVRKRRRWRCFPRRGFDFTLCLDEVDLLGIFVELEILATKEQQAAAEAALNATADELGLAGVESRSYLQMTLEALARDRPPDISMAVVSSVVELRTTLKALRRGGRSVGLVPTMGALHEGHLSLIRTARGFNDVVAVSIFVNPAQFGPHEDLSRYPRPVEHDLELCRAAGVDLVFHPALVEMYPPGFCTQVEVTGLQDVLEGASRPGHFRGVCTVVLKLFNLVQPDRAYFGQKDGQQAAIVRRMVRDLDVPVEVVVCPTVREPDGLALSSRNAYLDPEQRQQATVLSRALNAAGELAEAGERSAEVLRRRMEEIVASLPAAQLDYAAVVSANTLTPLERVEGEVLLALAVRLGNTRLIDNLPLALRE